MLIYLPRYTEVYNALNSSWGNEVMMCKGLALTPMFENTVGSDALSLWWYILEGSQNTDFIGRKQNREKEEEEGVPNPPQGCNEPKTSHLASPLKSSTPSCSTSWVQPLAQRPLEPNFEGFSMAAPPGVH